MKKLVCIALCMAIAACCTLSLAAKDDKMETDPYAVPQVKNAPIALLYEETTDTVLFSREADKPNPPASMTKVMTATLVLEYDPELKGTMVVPEEAMSKENCSWLDTDHLEVGEEVSVWDLMNYLLIASGNEAATTLAIYVAGDIPTFVDMMNKKAAELGMTSTHYVDPHGLSSVPQLITANDMLKLCRYAMKNDTFRKIVSTREGSIPASNKRSEAFCFRNSNSVLDPLGNRFYDTGFSDDIIGIKTGYIPDSGMNLSCAMRHGELRFYSVVMKGKGMFLEGEPCYTHCLDTATLMRYARTFARFGYGEGELVEQAKSGLKCLDVAADRDVYILYQDNKQPDYTVTYVSDIASAKKGDTVGTITLRDEFGNVRTAELIAAKDAAVRAWVIYAAAGLIIAIAAVCIALGKRSRAK